MLRDFKKYMGVPAETVKKEFDRIHKEIESGIGLRNISQKLFEKLLYYWKHQLKLLRGFEKMNESLSNIAKPLVNGFLIFKCYLKNGALSMEKNKWILCPVCNSKTRLQIREDTELRNFPLYCPKCKQETLVDVKKLQVTIIKEPDA